ncbi:hypothetical protein SAMN06265173_1087 [Thalassovita litoralis]|jgi:hypothetical protein|uniref:Lipoprotein n=1 Tax=Thalassovita litoralis TaxID=1010611 RepID=A0A521CYC0_9RHOB|nr:hypothetical protein [Thalassovita litoralis]SMO63751.1 hypothetical protein SAMN06265173_1087 [Thalassovita litoralis]
MRIPLSALLISTLVLTGCGNSRLNPMNWFGRAKSTPVATAENTNPLIPQRRGSILRREQLPYAGQLMSQVKTLHIERTPGGALVRVSGIAQFQRPYEVRLIPTNNKQPVNGVLTFDLKAVQPGKKLAQGSEWTRTVTAATFLTDNELDGVRTIQVQAAQNTMSSRRR